MAAATLSKQHFYKPTIGVLLTNLGTPDAPTTVAVRRYLAEFLSDPRVIDYPRFAWWCILNGIILRVRPSRSAKAYKTIWSDAGSPLLVNLRKQAHLLRERLRESGHTFHVICAMRYGNPSISAALDDFSDRGIEKIVVLPLYPQYSAATTASTFDAIAHALKTTPNLPNFRFISDYHDHPLYIEALSDSVRSHWRENGRSERLLMSFHGLPTRYVLNGDAYYRQCLATADRLAAKLDLTTTEWRVAFQSRVGREPWLKPYTDEVLSQWGSENSRSVTVICPGFSSDCLETLEEIDDQYRQLYLGVGGRNFSYIPALNTAPAHIELLATLIHTEIGSW